MNNPVTKPVMFILSCTCLPAWLITVIYFAAYTFVQGVESLPDDTLLGDEGEGETTLVDESTIVDDPAYNQQPPPEQLAANLGERSAPPTRQKDGQPLEPLHEVEVLPLLLSVARIELSVAYRCS